MDGASLVVGRSYALRERVSTGAPIRRVKLVDVVGRRGKIKIRYENEPHEGLEEYVSTRNIVVPWGEVRALLRDVEDQEAEWKHGGYGPGDRYLHDLLREHAPAFAVARTWAGFDSEIKTLREEIDRLRNLLYGAAMTLQRSGQEREGRRLERALDGK